MTYHDDTSSETNNIFVVSCDSCVSCPQYSTLYEACKTVKMHAPVASLDTVGRGQHPNRTTLLSWLHHLAAPCLLHGFQSAAASSTLHEPLQPWPKGKEQKVRRQNAVPVLPLTNPDNMDNNGSDPSP
ncbi:hypothetical protein NDU88_002262 [Pleurodeles waltl]|uniref:Uncharacterized protein n=1 Tax=Pleurodeles waltl TaxID=8319 RepID=A0AAV7VYW2_PLEWA|nr:hypothetical protein NDU88_002262 [Pleurodeles waltl]